MRNFVFILLYTFSFFELNAQVEIFKGESDTSKYIAPEDTITKSPKYKNGENDFFQYIQQEFNTRMFSSNIPFEGVDLRFSFVVEKNGQISDFKSLFSTYQLAMEEMQRIIESMPRWTPGKQVGVTKRITMIYDLKLNLNQQTSEVYITKNGYYQEYSPKTKYLKWYIVSATVLIMATLLIIK